MKTFTFIWLGNTSLIFRNTATRDEYEVKVGLHGLPEGTIEHGLIADNYFETNKIRPIYFTYMHSSDVDEDTMKLFLSELTQLPVDQIRIQRPSRLP